MDRLAAKNRRMSPLATPTALGADATKEISGALTKLLADVFALFLKTKNFHWHMSGPHFRDYHLMLDEQGEQIFSMTDEIAERARKIGGTTIRSIGHISREMRLLDNDADFVAPNDMLAELRDDNVTLTSLLKETHALCGAYGDIATASLLENWLNETERRGSCSNARAGATERHSQGGTLLFQSPKSLKSIANGQHQSRCEDYNSRLALKHGHEDTRARMVPPTRHVDKENGKYANHR